MRNHPDGPYAPPAMSAYTDRLDSLRQQAHDAERAMYELDETQWPTPTLDVASVSTVFAYARTVLETADAELISDAMYSQITGSLAQFVANPAAGAQNADTWASAVLDGVGLLPAARDRMVDRR